MSNVLIANSYFYKLDKKQWKFKQPYPPLATILAASVLQNQGYHVSLFDTNLRDSATEIIPLLERHQPEYLIIYDDGFNYLSKMCLSNMREAAFDMIREAKIRRCTVIVSSSDATDNGEKYLQAGADLIIQGEAEETLLEALNALEKSRPLHQINGLSFTHEGRTITTSPRVVMKNLDALPMPAWDLIDIEAYRNIWQRHHGYFSLNIATTRGCPFKCNWCAKPIYGNRYNTRSTAHVAEEIEFLLNTFKPDHFWMCDDIFGLKPGWIQEFNAVVQQKELKFKYKIQSRVDLLLEEDTISALAQSGAETVWVGAESGSQKILDAMDKGTTVQQIRKATEILNQHQIKVGFFLQFGYLGETREDIRKTIKMLLELMPDEVGISVSYPLPGTKFYDKVKYQLKEKQNWTDSDDLAMMFQSTFHRDFYKQLHRFVHSLYRRKKGILTLKKIIQSPLSFSVKDVKSLVGIVYFGTSSIILKQKLSRYSRQTSLESVLQAV